jgi:hypothetical protein
MVIYRGADGKPGYHQTDDIHDAVGFVEQMRNEEGVEHARIFRLEEVVFEYRPYYRVELAGAAPQPMVAMNGAEVDPAQLGGPSLAQPLNALHGKPAAPEAIELPDDVIEVIDGLDETTDPGVEQAAGKSLFGR